MKSSKCRRKTCKRSSIKTRRLNPSECIVDNLEDIGREQFFRHYPYSELPIRDITEKPEPHIEIGAENYLVCCYQSNIRGFCHSHEKYLFLCTTCKNRGAGERKFLGKRFVVGYIKKKACKDMGDRLAVIGDTYIVPFDKKLNYDSLGFSRGIYMQKFSIQDTKMLLRLINSHENVVNKCVEEMIEKEGKERERGKGVAIDSKCLKNRCKFRNQCLRRKSH